MPILVYLSSLIRTLPSAQEFHLLGSFEFADFNRRYGISPFPKDIKNFGCPSAYAVEAAISVIFYYLLKLNYARIEETTPEPTVLPPSRIAKRRPSSIAIGVISSTVISTLSPGRHISTSAGRPITPVTSVVLK